MSEPKEGAHIALEAFELMCNDVASPFAEKAKRLLGERSFEALASLDLDPSAYRTSASFAADYAVYAFLRKYEGFPLTRDLHRDAISTFESVELECRRTNFRLAYPTRNGVESILSDARRKISGLLGRFSFAKVLPGCDWGPGATSTLKRVDAALDKKILEPRLAVTSRALRYAKAYLSVDYHWLQSRIGWSRETLSGPACPVDSEFAIVEGARFTTVPKTVKQRRSINIEPTMNLFLQKGVGKYLRRRLQRIGIDLDDQSRNQVLASRAHVDGYATIDLKNASDSISRELVRCLLPTDWFEYLNDIRSHYVEIEGRPPHRLEKFSAMGNGFTFELESLIFWSLCESVSQRIGSEPVVSVYGDDLVVDRAVVVELYRVLEECGFTVNKEKSFVDGHFFESCGKHYFDGIEVTPAYQKEILSDTPSLYRGANRLIRLASRLGEGEFLDYRLKRAISYLWAQCGHEAALQFRGPFWLEGDGHLIDPYYRPKADRHGVFKVFELRSIPLKRKLRCDGPLLATALRRGVVVESPFNGQLPLHGRERVLRCLRNVTLRHDETPVWASMLSR